MQIDTRVHGVRVSLPNGRFRHFTNIGCAAHTALDFYKQNRDAADESVTVTMPDGVVYRSRYHLQRALEAYREYLAAQSKPSRTGVRQ